MPRPRSVDDDVLLLAALDLVHRDGPAALSFAALAERVELAPSTLVQRFGTKPELLRRTLLAAWDQLEQATTRAIDETTEDAAGVIDMLVALSGDYDARDPNARDPDAGDYADQLLVLREDLRDPVLRARGERWIGTLVAAIDARLSSTAAGACGAIVVAQWQGAATVWSFTRPAPIAEFVRRSLTELLGLIGAFGDPPD